MWYVYILECKNKTLYAGITNDIPRRVTEHKQSKGGHYTRSFGVNTLVYQEECSDKQEALKREAQIKGWTHKKKLALIKGDMKLLKEL
ncbi:MAG: GIY-YIG nuclease family protein [Candidatus Omnitrophica bacterium]|nr:GIY-YIG nuclease family protein [Candidatus Omnitrophota bacterium]